MPRYWRDERVRVEAACGACFEREWPGGPAEPGGSNLRALQKCVKRLLTLGWPPTYGSPPQATTCLQDVMGLSFFLI